MSELGDFCLICGRRDPYGRKQGHCMRERKCQYLGQGDNDADRQAIKFFGAEAPDERQTK